MARRISRWAALVVPVIYLLLHAGAIQAQAPFLKGPDQQAKAADNSNFIFAALYSNLKTWPSAYAPNGRAMVPATIKAGTLLYHSGVNPIGMGWFANMLYTYAATRPLRSVYFDGFSAEKGADGTQDMQDMLIGLDNTYDLRAADSERGRLLCEWGKQYDIQGFVREEATFELLWCDFEDGVQMLSVINITIPANPNSEDALLDTHGDSFEEEPPRDDGPAGGTGGHGPPDRGAPTLYTNQANWLWYLATASHHTMPDSRVILHPAYTITLYDAKYTSLAANTKLPRRKHRLIDISPADKAVFHAELDEAITAWIDDPRGEGSGVDWSSIAHAIIKRSGDSIAELHTLLANVNATSKVTDVVSTARLIAFALIMPYADHAAVFAPTITAASRSAVLADISLQCSLAFTGHIDAQLYRLTPQEERLKGAVEGVSRRICAFAAGTFDESLNLLESLAGEVDFACAQAQAVQALERWLGNVEELMEWLGWAIWKRCPEVCGWDEVCYIHMWPLNIDSNKGGPDPASLPPPVEDGQELKPRCAKRSEF
ncbi:hypothetical protein FIBSPDRAFT_1048534 [Athelia psychrophila]|uniref:Uncharacterized protein n=1 Tax=Athelia psychrophila TaxID=1759441 RepID=A0A166DMR2_9AGAM|nr:hypothetical protein FIBSPDRAFT_1048534 [Fibularhizoctonia sp. CBS 109695]